MPRQTADALERVTHHVALPAQLCGIGKMLYLAAAANTEDPAERLRARRRFREDLQQLSHGVLLFDVGDAYARSLLRQRPKAKDRHAAGAADTLAVSEKVGKLELDLRAPLQGRRSFRRCVSARQAPLEESSLRRSALECGASSDPRDDRPRQCELRRPQVPFPRRRDRHRSRSRRACARADARRGSPSDPVRVMRSATACLKDSRRGDAGPWSTLRV